MNLKQILKTVVRALMTVVAIKSVNADDDGSYTTSFICPTPNIYDCTKPIRGTYFTEKGLLHENSSAVIEGVTWGIIDVFSNSAPMISDEISYYLARDYFYKFEPDYGCCQTNMRICGYYSPSREIKYGVERIPAKEKSSVTCEYESPPKERDKYGISRFKLITHGKRLYKDSTSGYSKTFVSDSIDSYPCLCSHCIDKKPSNCKVAVTFFKDTKQKTNQTASASMCLVL